MRSSSMFWIIIGIAVALGTWLISLYNGMVKRRNHVEDGWSGIDVQLKRRHNLIPNLVNIVKKYASHEKEVMESVTRLRSASSASQSTSANQEQQISHALNGLMLQVEAYPDLKSDTNFRDLQQQLSEIESDIQYARRYYNGAVREYNTSIQSFPAVLIAQQFGFLEAEFFELDDNDVAREVPKVDFE